MGLRHVPALDGLRAVAITLVVLFHARAPFAPGGFVGVDVFFVLSGFLITSLLLTEIDATRTVRLAAFYERRARRLTPAFVVMLIAYLVAAPLLWPDVPHMLHAVLAGLYLSDYSIALAGLPSILSHTWSLAVEAHFYLLWPLVVLAARRRFGNRGCALLFAGIWLLACLWRAGFVLGGQEWNAIYYRFDTRLTGLILGSFVAAAMRDERLHQQLQRMLPASPVWIIAWAVALIALGWGDTLVLAAGLPLVEVAAAVLLMAAMRPGVVSRTLARGPLVWVGQMSYGVYLWHYPVLRVLRDAMPWEATLLVGVPISLALAAASFYTVEAWLRRSGHRVERAGAVQVGVLRRDPRG